MEDEGMSETEVEKYRMKLWIKVAAATARCENTYASDVACMANRVLRSFDETFDIESE